MRIAAYVQPLRTVGRVSGVGKHVGRLPPALAQRAEVKLLCARDQLESNGQLPCSSPLIGLPHAALPWRAKMIEWGGALLNRPRLDKWTGSADWLFCPAETPVSVTRTRLAITAHASDWAEPDLPWAREFRYVHQRVRWRLIYRAIRKRRALVLAVSEFLRGRLIDRVGLDPRLVKVVGNGVEDEYFTADAEKMPPEIRNIRPYIIVIGGLSVYKGGDRILSVARELRARRSELRLLVVGDSDPKMSCEADSLGNVISLGYVGLASGLPAMLAGAVALLFLSRYETFGIPVWEAWAAGTPALITNVGALAGAESIVDPDRPADIAERIEQLHRNDGSRKELVVPMRQKAEQFRWDCVADRVLAALSE